MPRLAVMTDGAIAAQVGATDDAAEAVAVPTLSRRRPTSPTSVCVLRVIAISFRGGVARLSQSRGIRAIDVATNPPARRLRIPSAPMRRRASAALLIATVAV